MHPVNVMELRRLSGIIYIFSTPPTCSEFLFAVLYLQIQKQINLTDGTIKMKQYTDPVGVSTVYRQVENS
jgi:hypothetical protein